MRTAKSMPLKILTLTGTAMLMLLATLHGVLVAADEPAAAPAKGTITIDGSTTVEPLAKAFAEYLRKSNPELNIQISGSGSGNGATALINNKVDIADMSRFMKDTEFKAAVGNGVLPVAHVVAMDGIAVVVHPSNPLKDLKAADVKAIYDGTISNWKELGGPDAPIVRISRDTASGTYEAFGELVMQKAPMVRQTEYVNSSGQMHSRVSETPAAIGYLGIGYVDRKVKALAIDGVVPTERTVATGTYPVARPLFMFTNGYPKIGSPLHSFITLHLTKAGEQIVREVGYVPVTSYKE